MRRLICDSWPLGRRLALAAAIFFACTSLVLGAPPRQAAEPPKEPVYALEYGVAIFVPLIALALVFRPGKRTELEDELKLPFERLGPNR